MGDHSKINKVLKVLDFLDTLDLISDSDEKLIHSNWSRICVDIFKNNSPNKNLLHKSLRDMSNPTEKFSNEEFKLRYTFSKETIYEILRIIEHNLQHTTNCGKPIPPLLQLLTTIRFMITGSFQSLTDDLYGISQPAISRMIYKVSTVLSNLKDDFIKFPTQQEIFKLSSIFHENYNLPEVIGSIGTTHVNIKNPGGQFSEIYLNENGYYSLKVQVHELMLRDEARNSAYKNAIMNNKDFINGKTVLDVGAGTGILSVFCAQAGAAKVYAVEASGLHRIARAVVSENKFEEIVDVIHSRVEDLCLPNDEKVDVIVSEWMGFYLLHEGMLDSVIFARDKFLKPDGRMFPESATLYCAPCSDPSVYDFWKSIDGVSMECVGQEFRRLKTKKPEIKQIKDENLLSEGKAIAWYDLKEVTSEELDTIYAKEVVASDRDGLYQGLCIWFSCQFPQLNDESAVVLSTAPDDPATHWKQTVIVLPTEMSVEEGSPIAYELVVRRCQEHNRRYDIQFTMIDPNDIDHPEPCSCYMTKCIIIKKMINQYVAADIL